MRLAGALLAIFIFKRYSFFFSEIKVLIYVSESNSGFRVCDLKKLLS